MDCPQSGTAILKQGILQYYYYYYLIVLIVLIVWVSVSARGSILQTYGDYISRITLSKAPILLRGTTVNRTYGTHNNLYIYLFLLALLGPTRYLL